jgi:type II secretion system protein N
MNPWVRKAGLAALGAGWCGLVFIGVFRATFPSDALAERARLAVSDATGGSIDLDIGSVSPAWIGVRGHDVVLSTVSGDTATPVLAIERVRAVTGLLSALRGAPRVSGDARFGDGRLDFDATLAADDAGQYGAEQIQVTSSGFPIAALPPVLGTRIVGDGTLDLIVDVDAAEGLRTAAGELRLSGSNLQINELSGGFGSLAGTFGVVPATIAELDFDFDIVEGKAQVARLVIDSTLALVEGTGDITLQQRLLASRVRIDLVIEPREGLSRLESTMRAARWNDGKYHYRISGTLGNMSLNPQSERRARNRNNNGEEAAPDAAAPDADADVPANPTPRAERTGSRATLDAARQAREQLVPRPPGGPDAVGAGARVIPVGGRRARAAGDEDTGAPPRAVEPDGGVEGADEAP